MTGFVADLTVEAEVGALADAIGEQLGTVDILVNNAGLASKASPEVLRPVAQLLKDSGIPQQGEDAVGNQVDRGLVAGEEQKLRVAQ